MWEWGYQTFCSICGAFQGGGYYKLYFLDSYVKRHGYMISEEYIWNDIWISHKPLENINEQWLNIYNALLTRLKMKSFPKDCHKTKKIMGPFRAKTDPDPNEWTLHK